MKLNFRYFIKTKKIQAFTLVEVLVATTVFSIIAISAISILSVSNKAYRKISDTRIVMDNLNIVSDTINRNLKFGTDYYCLSTSGNFKEKASYNSFASPSTLTETYDCNAISFIPVDRSTTRVVYYFNTSSSTLNEVIYNYVGGTYIKSQDNTMTSPDIIIKKVNFGLFGNSKSDFLQPRINMLISGYVLFKKGMSLSTSSLTIQTTIVQRVLDNN